MSVRLLCLIVVRPGGWLVLPGRSPTSQNAALAVLRHEAAVLRRARPRPGRTGPTARSSPPGPGCCQEGRGCAGRSPPAPSRGGTAARSPRGGPARTGQDGRGQLHPPRPDHLVAGLSPERINRQTVPGGLISEYERAA